MEEGKVIDLFFLEFFGFVFKIQVNMNLKYWDWIVFVWVCLGEFDCGMDVILEWMKKLFWLLNVIEFMVNIWENVEKVVVGDIIGLYDIGNF